MQAKHTLQKIDTQFTELSEGVSVMGSLVLEQLDRITLALENDTVVDVSSMAETEDSINDDEVRIDLACKTALAKFSPSASDLRFVLGISKIVGHLERIADEAMKIAEGTSTVQENIEDLADRSELLHSFLHMLTHCREQLNASLSAFADNNVTEAQVVIDGDLVIDEEYRALLKRYVEFLKTHPDQAESAMNLWIIAKSAERLADHAKHIGRAVIYMVNG